MKRVSEIQAIVASCKYPGLDIHAESMNGWGCMVQVSYMGPDVDPPHEYRLQKGRKWYVSPWATETEIVNTVFMAVSRFVQHELEERFTYQGHRTHSPHMSIQDRIRIAERGKWDHREET